MHFAFRHSPSGPVSRFSSSLVLVRFWQSGAVTRLVSVCLSYTVETLSSRYLSSAVIRVVEFETRWETGDGGESYGQEEGEGGAVISARSGVCGVCALFPSLFPSPISFQDQLLCVGSWARGRESDSYTKNLLRH